MTLSGAGRRPADGVADRFAVDRDTVDDSPERGSGLVLAPSSATVPVESVPMKLPSSRLLDEPEIWMPADGLAEMKLPEPGAVPPMVFWDIPFSMRTPSMPFPRRCIPVSSGPMEFPSTTLPVVPASLISTPSPVLPEMMLRAVGRGPADRVVGRAAKDLNPVAVGEGTCQVAGDAD